MTPDSGVASEPPPRKSGDQGVGRLILKLLLSGTWAVLFFRSLSSLQVEYGPSFSLVEGGGFLICVGFTAYYLTLLCQRIIEGGQ